MKKVFQAQSTLELIMVIILVLAGIFVMGPYVVRSVNAYMRSWEISVDQANNNPNVKLNPWEVPGSTTPSPPSVSCSYFNNNSGDCDINNGLLDCTWVTQWWNYGDASQPCSSANYCIETVNLTAGVDCQGNWFPGMDCCWAQSGCPMCPHYQ